MVTGLRTPGVASPLQQQYLTRSNKDSIVLRLRVTCIRVRWGGFTLILNRIRNATVTLKRIELINLQRKSTEKLISEEFSRLIFRGKVPRNLYQMHSRHAIQPGNNIHL